MHISNWGKYPVIDGNLHALRSFDPEKYSPWIARGMGRSYGDASLAPHMVNTLTFNRFLSFDPETGSLHCEAGVTFDEILRYFIPKGWFPPVTPGTKYVTLGGALAADIHGKNHHSEGSISQHVDGFELQLPSGEIVRCSTYEAPELFWATLGGMGLTGIIRTVWLRMKPIQTPLIHMQTIRAKNLEEILALFDTHQAVTYSVAWIDCLSKGDKMGRSLLMLGEHATRNEVQKARELKARHGKKVSVPVDLPSFVLNPLSIKAFNALYYRKQFAKTRSQFVGYDSFFYPLDTIHDWNRIYGKRGFTQYQIVIPKDAGRKGLEEVLRRIAGIKMGSFLAVLKLMGPMQQAGPLAFPMEGYTLALDFPVKDSLFPFLHLLDKFVAGLGGRVYLAKDARMEWDMFEQMYPQKQAFVQTLHNLGNTGQVQSELARRLRILGS